jgi:hypothetical protein
MKTIAVFTMALTTLVLATAADADAQDQRCLRSGRHGGYGEVYVRAGTPCTFIGVGAGGIGMILATEIVESPHNGTAVARADGGIIFYPKPGFTGKDSVRARFTVNSFPNGTRTVSRDFSINVF